MDHPPLPPTTTNKLKKKRNKFLAQKAALEEVKDKFNEIMNLAHSM